MEYYGLHGKLKAKKGKGEDVVKILLYAAKILSKTTGCHLYIIGQEPNDSDSIWVYEVWNSKEDHDLSLDNPRIRELTGQAIPLLEGDPQSGRSFTIRGGLGL